MISTFAALRSLIKAKKIHNDFLLFRLHHRVTVLFLLTFCLIVSAKLMFGDPIDCSSNMFEDRPYMDNYCWSKGTFTVHNVVIEVTNGSYPYPYYQAPGMPMGASSQRLESNIHQHSYYPYVHLILFFQAVLFYVPHYLWKIWENGTISEVCQQLQEHRHSAKSYLEANRHLLTYVRQCLNINNTLAIKYYFCHILMFINLVAQFLWLDWLLNGQFLNYGIQVVRYFFYEEDIYPTQVFTDGHSTRLIGSPLDNVFPKLTTCDFISGSPAGASPTNSKATCVLPFQILHDKIFLFLWFWFVALVTLTALHLVYCTFYMTFPVLRTLEFEKRFRALLRPGYKIPSSLTELFVLHMIGNNLDPLVFKMVLEEMETINCEALKELNWNPDVRKYNTDAPTTKSSVTFPKLDDMSNPETQV